MFKYVFVYLLVYYFLFIKQIMQIITVQQDVALLCLFNLGINLRQTKYNFKSK